MGFNLFSREAELGHVLVVVTALLVYFGVTRTLHRRSYPSAVLSWVLSLIFIPYIALPLFLLFGTRKFVRREGAPRAEPGLTAGTPEEAWPQRLAASMDLSPAAGYTALTIHEDGAAARRALLQVMRGAQTTLDVSTFILGRDALGDEVVRELVARAGAGVRVRLLIDGVGRFLDGHPSLRPLSAGGVEVAVFMPILHSPREGRTNLRNHRKLVIADGERLWCGGRNLAAEYFEGAPGVKVWRDLTFDLEGGPAAVASQCFARDWAFATKRTERASHTPIFSAGRSAQLFPSGPDQSYDTVLALLVSTCFRSNTRIQAVTPYFVPDQALLMALTLAARRGVEVDLLVPARSNHRLADIARHRALRDLSRAGGRVWLCPDMIHAKAMVSDDTLAIAGSANLDSRSLFLNYELMFAFYDPQDAARFASWIERQRHDAMRYRPRKPSLSRDLLEGLILWVAFQL